MILTSDKDLESFENICNPIVIIDEEYKIFYSNKNFNKIVKIGNNHYYKGQHIGDYLVECNGVKNRIEKILNENKVIAIDKENFNLEVTPIIIDGTSYLMLNFLKIDNDEKQLDLHNEINNYGISNAQVVGAKQLSYKALNTILTSSPNGIIVQNDRKIVFSNKKSKDILCGNIHENILGKNLFDIISFEEMDNIRINLEDINYDEYSSLSASQKKIVRKDGSYVYIEVSTMCFMEEEEIYTAFIFKDITKRLKMEQKIERSKTDYLRLLQFIPFGVAVFNNSDEVIFANESILSIVGVKSREELNDIPLSDLVHEDYVEDICEVYKTMISSESKIEHKEIVFKRKDGSLVETEIGAINIYYADQRSILLIINDLTEVKRNKIENIKLEQAVKYEKMKMEFIASMSHELKTPLNIILGIAQLSANQLRQNKYDNEESIIGKYTDVLRQNCYRLLRLINNLIDVNDLDSGSLKMNFKNHNIVKIVEDVTLSTVDYVEKKGLSIVFDTNVEEKIIGIDKGNIERVMLNLLSNAVKFSKYKGEIYVSVQDNEDEVQIHVKDNGIGIEEDKIDNIFDKFVQGESLFTRAHEGSGIGLCLVKSIVEAHGGGVKVFSKLGEGSEFIVTLPNIISKNRCEILKFVDEMKSNEEKIMIEFSDII